MDFNQFIETAWNEHADQPQAVADRLVESTAVIARADDVAPFARLVTHVYGEHLGLWTQGVALLEALRAHPHCNDTATAALNRGIATLRYAGGDSAALAPLEREDRIAVLAATSAALVGRGDTTGALAAYAEALQLAEDGLPAGSPALRALAVGGNNLAATLEEKPDRDAEATQGMVAAAHGALKYWRLAGTWLEEERALYRLARSLLQAGDPYAAAENARHCVDVCQRNDAPAFEQFFAFVVLALSERSAGNAQASDAARSEALRWYGQVHADEQPWCKAELEALGAHSP